MRNARYLLPLSLRTTHCHCNKANNCSSMFTVRCSSTNIGMPRINIAVVGSGPAGFYTARHLIMANRNVWVDIYEKWPVPFGSVRFAVAPDRSITNWLVLFMQTARHEQVGFYGNVNVGTDISIAELMKAYSAVVLCYGASEDKKLGIPGEESSGVISAREFVGWYSGNPEFKDLQPNLQCDTVVILGMGATALDVSRMILTPASFHKHTSMAFPALSAFNKCKVRRVVVIGRRGLFQVAFTIEQLREIRFTPGVRLVVDQNYFEQFKILRNNRISELALPSQLQRVTQLLMKVAWKLMDRPCEEHRVWELMLLRSPVEVLTGPKGQTIGVRLVKNKLEGLFECPTAVPTGEYEVIRCGQVIRSIGYQNIPIDPDIPFDEDINAVPHMSGRVIGRPGLYCSGWIKQGPTELIPSVKESSTETSRSICEDIDNGSVKPSREKTGHEMILPLLKQRGVQHVTFDDWKKINRYEVNKGDKFFPKKPRSKILDIHTMLKIANS